MAGQRKKKNHYLSLNIEIILTLPLAAAVRWFYGIKRGGAQLTIILRRTTGTGTTAPGVGAHGARGRSITKRRTENPNVKTGWRVRLTSGGPAQCVRTERRGGGRTENTIPPRHCRARSSHRGDDISVVEPSRQPTNLYRH